MLQEHLATFDQQWTDPAEGRTLPAFVTEELRGFLDCGILARGFAHLYCDAVARGTWWPSAARLDTHLRIH